MRQSTIYLLAAVLAAACFSASAEPREKSVQMHGAGLNQPIIHADDDDVPPAPVETATPGQTALFNPHEDAIECNRCGGRMVRAGTCYTCRDCGTSTGCG